MTCPNGAKVEGSRFVTGMRRLEAEVLLVFAIADEASFEETFDVSEEAHGGRNGYYFVERWWGARAALCGPTEAGPGPKADDESLHLLTTLADA